MKTSNSTEPQTGNDTEIQTGADETPESSTDQALHPGDTAAAKSYAEALCRHLIPDGRLAGRQWIAKAWSGGSGKDLCIFAVGKRAGEWSYAGPGGGSGNSLIEVWSHARGVDLAEAEVQLTAWLADQPPLKTTRAAKQKALPAAVEPHKAKLTHALVAADPAPPSDELSASAPVLPGGKDDTFTGEVQEAALAGAESSAGEEPADAINPKVLALRRLLTANEARDLTTQINASAIMLCVDIKRAYDGEAWRALGHSGWEAYVDQEFCMSRQRAYQLLDYAKVREVLAEVSTNVDTLPGEGAFRPLTRLKTPEQQREAYIEAVKLSPKGKPTARVFATVVDQMIGKSPSRRAAAKSSSDSKNSGDTKPTASVAPQLTPESTAPLVRNTVDLTLIDGTSMPVCSGWLSTDWLEVQLLDMAKEDPATSAVRDRVVAGQQLLLRLADVLNSAGGEMPSRDALEDAESVMTALAMQAYKVCEARQAQQEANQ